MFAYQRDTRQRVLRALANLSNFQGNERSPYDEGLTGLNGPYRRMTNVMYGALPREYARGLDEAAYVVYCYGTPIAWVTWDDDSTETGRVNYVPDWQYSPTTTYHQGLVLQAWGNCVDPNPTRSRLDNRGTARGRSAEARYGSTRTGRSVGSVPTDRPGRGLPNWVRERLTPAASAPVSTPTGPPPSYLLDRRLSDPDWTPEPLPEGADARDTARVQNDMARDGGRTRAHP